MERRCSGRRRQRVSEDDIERWVADEAWAERHRVEMMNAEIEWNRETSNDELRDESVELGSLSTHRPDGVIRALMTQLNNISTARVRNRKAAQLQRLVQHYEIQVIGMGEIGINMSLERHGKRLTTLLPDLGMQVRCTSAHNRLERISLHQPGGVGILLVGDVISFYKKGKKDFRGLGRWDSVIITGKQGHKTRLVQGYGVQAVRSEEFGSVYQQHLRYIQLEGFNVSPRELFEMDLLWQLQVWRAAGERIILMMDANEHVLSGRLCRQLTRAGIDLREITKDFLGELCPHTHSRGKRPIDGVWATPDITITGVKWLTFADSPGDHRACIFDFTTLSATGTNEKKIVLPKCRRLSTKNQRSVDNYVKELESQFARHKIIERMEALNAETEGQFPISAEHQLRHDRLDAQTVELQLHSESKCRKICSGPMPCSPDVSLWHKRARIFSQLIRMKEGRVRNPGLLCKQARKLGIVAPKRWSLDELEQGREISKAWKRSLEPHAPSLRTDLLSNKLVEAEASGNTVKAKAISGMIDRESNSRMWDQIKWVTNDDGGKSRSVTRVERIEDGVTVEYTSQEDIERVVREETQERFSAAASSSFCQGQLGAELGYVSNTDTAVSILCGEYECPETCSDSTVLLVEEIKRISRIVGQGAVRLALTSDEFKEYWNKAYEYTSSSRSSVHFGHYKAAAKVDKFASYFAQKISFIARTGSPPSRWGCGLNVLLEKIAGVALVHKLRAILLMEADFNMHNRLVFGNRMMEIAREAELIPPEQFAERQSDGQDGAWFKKLLADISRQAKLAMGWISADAGNCYDRIAHAFASLVFQAFGVFISAVMAMLCTIQTMKFYLRTGFGESPGFMTALLGAIIHGLCQGNTASPAGWSVICAVLLAVYKKRGHGARFYSPVSGDYCESAGVLFVDDVDLMTMDEDILQIMALWSEVQNSLITWSDVINDSGGIIKGEKSFGYMFEYAWDDDGQWFYKPTLDYNLQIKLPNGTFETIELLEPGDARVTLGVAACPTGDDSFHLVAPGSAKDKWKSVKTKAEVWLMRLKNGHLPSKYAWVSYRLQLWASIRYGLGVLSAPLASLGELCPKFAFQALPLLGINRNIRGGWRYLHSSFGGCGLLDLATEATISRCNMFLQHWDNPAPLGKCLRASMEYLQLEVGCHGCPLSESFEPIGRYCTHSWVRSFWECISWFGIDVSVDYPILPYPRENDRTLLEIWLAEGVKDVRLRSLMRCRIFLCAIFLSDIATANGRRIDQQRTDRGVDHRVSSNFRFAPEHPSASDWEVWDSFWKTYCLSDGSFPRPLGKWKHTSHKIWGWYYDEGADVIYQRTKSAIWVYQCCPETTGSNTRSQAQYARVGCLEGIVVPAGAPVSVSLTDDFTVVRHATGSPIPLDSGAQEEEFWTELRRWGGEWMWDHTYMPYGFDAVIDAVLSGSAVYVTDGSYNRSIRPDLNGAGWLIYCKSRRKIVFKGSFCEVNAAAGSYRGELLGLLAIHVFVLAVCEFYGCNEGSKGLVACDNLGGLNKSKERRKKIPSGAKHADILRSLRRVHARLKGRLQYQHVYGHQDRRKTYAQMTLLERLNCKCDTLAKAAVHEGILSPPELTKARQRLPLESAAIYYKGAKISRECGAEIRFQAGRVAARKFYLEELGWLAATFDCVDWDARDRSLASKPDMFKIWLFKQGSSFCATGKNLGRWFGEPITCCPNCHCPQEDSAHLLHCPDPGRFGFFRSEVNDLQKWLNREHTKPAIAEALYKYILGRGKVKFCDVEGLPGDLWRLAEEQDLIGWDNFMEGKISSQFEAIQHEHLLNAPTVMNASDWTKQLISKLLHITHGQWIYRNISRHHTKLGLLKDMERRQLLVKIDRLMSIDPSDVPEESKFLLEIDFRAIRVASTERQSYWVHAVRAAVKAGRRAAQYKHRNGRAPAREEDGKQRFNAAAPPLGFGSTDDCSEWETSEGRKRRAGRGSHVFSDGSNKRRKPD